MSSPAVELAQYVADELGYVFGGNSDWSFHATREPAEPANVVTFYDTDGRDPLVIDGAEILQPAIQVRARSFDYLEAYEVQKAVYDVLQQPGLAELDTDLAREIGTGRYIGINLAGDIIAIGRDDNDRQLVVANYTLIRQPLEGS